MTTSDTPMTEKSLSEKFEEIIHSLDQESGLFCDDKSLAQYNDLVRWGREAISELNEFESLFQIRWKADMRAIQQWREKTGKELTSPDHADLVVFLSEALTAERSKNAEANETLQFVERWANHHGQKDCMTPAEALSCIQHYPPILAITRGYADGKVPETPNPWALLEAEREKNAKLREEVLEEAAKAVEGEICGCCWDDDAQAFAEHAAETLRAMKEKK